MNFPAHLAAALLAAQTGAGVPTAHPSDFLQATRTVMGERVAPPADSVRSHRRARTLQTRFERLRLRNLPRIPDSDSHECDEIIGRLCIWDDGDDEWTPKPEPAAIVDGREALLAGLDSLAALVPGDHWVLGQRIRYLVEAGRLTHAAAVARRCGLPDRWRCDAYLGYVLHHQADFAQSEAAFRRALQAMPADVREDWTSPAPVLGRELRRWVSARPDSTAALARLWTLADPLFLVEGNDRWTGHMSRWSYAMSAERATNPFDLNWGKDFTEYVVRYGWPIAWERTWPRVGQTRFGVAGRDLPTAFRAFPAREVLDRGPAGEEPVTWEEEEDHPRAAYLPPYLDSLGALDAQVGRFWRTGHVVVVGAWRAPDAGGVPDGHDDVEGPRDPAPGPVLSGLFVEQGGTLTAAERTMAEPGSTLRLSARVPWAEWGTLSLETWAPDLRTAHRHRAGMGFPQLPFGLFAVSDLMFLESGEEPSNLEELVGSLRPPRPVEAGETLGIALEVYGLGTRREAVQFSVRVEKRGEGILRRMGYRLGILDPPDQASIDWREEGPQSPGPLLRTLQVDLSGLGSGEYLLVVEVSAAGRATLQAQRGFTVRRSARSH